MFARKGFAPLIATCATLLACSQGDMTGPGDGVQPPPPAVVTYDVVVTLKQLKALGDCDRNERLFGASVGGPGEFAYTIWATVDGSTPHRVETPAYGQRGTGTASRLIDNGAVFDLNETFRLTRSTGQSFTLGIAAIEWDGLILTVRDPILKGDVKQRSITIEEIGEGGLGYEVLLGDNENCGLRFTYGVTRTAR